MSSRSRATLALVVRQSHSETSDADLARGLVADEPWAIDATWHRFAPMVMMTAERVLGSKSEAEDLAQEVFARLYRTVKTLRDPESLRSFIYSIAIRSLKSALRYRRLRAWLSFHEPENLVELPSATLDVESRDLLRKFHVLLDRLSPRDRLVFTLRRVESMTIEEIATTMELSVSTVKRSMLHASNRLSRWVEADPQLSSLWDMRSLAK
jgi:RNA polymerase sigma-70 factor, ECF subfamily